MHSTLAPDWLDRDILAQAFLEMPTPHGTKFDDGRRWCGRCNKTVLTCEPVTANEWADKMCPRCTAIWPEYMDLYQLWVMMEHDDDDAVVVEYMN